MKENEAKQNAMPRLILCIADAWRGKEGINPLNLPRGLQSPTERDDIKTLPLWKAVLSES